MSRWVRTGKTRLRLAIVWLVASVFPIGYTQANAAAADNKNAVAAAVTRLPFNEVVALSGGLTVAANGQAAAHVSASGEVVLWDPASGKLLETIPANGKEPGAVALSLAGDLVAVGYADARVVIWSRRERKSVRELGGHSRSVSALAFSPDGQLLASGGSDSTTQVWEVETGRRLHVFDSRYGDPVGSDGGDVLALGFSGDGRALVVNEGYRGQYEPDRGTSLWDVNEGIEIDTRHVTPPNTGYFVGVGQALGGGGWMLVYTGRDGLMVERLDVCEASPRQMSAGGYADTVAADPHGRWVAASEPENLTFFGTSGDPQGRSVELPEKAVALAAHPDGQSVFALLVKADSIGNIDYKNGAIYRVAVPEPLWRLPPMTVKPGATHCPPSAVVRAVQDFHLPEKPLELPVAARFVPKGDMFRPPTSGGNEEGIKPVSPPHDMYFGANGDLYILYYGFSSDEYCSGVAVWDTRAQRPLRASFRKYIGEPILRLRDGWAVQEDVNSLDHLLTGKPIFRSTDNRPVELRIPDVVVSDPDTGDVYRGVRGRIERYASDGRRSPDVATGTKTPVTAAARNGNLAVLFQDNSVQLWRAKSDTNPKTFGPLPNEGNCAFEKLTLSADGRYLRTDFDCGDGGSMYWMFDFETTKWAPTHFFAAPLPARANRAVVPDDRLNRLAVLDLAKGEIIARLPRHRSRDKHGSHKLLLAAISDDGRLVASAAPDGSVRVWDIDARQMRGEAKLGGEVTAVAFDSTGQRLAAARGDGEVVVFRIPAPVAP